MIYNDADYLSRRAWLDTEVHIGILDLCDLGARNCWSTPPPDLNMCVYSDYIICGLFLCHKLDQLQIYILEKRIGKKTLSIYYIFSEHLLVV